MLAKTIFHMLKYEVMKNKTLLLISIIAMIAFSSCQKDSIITNTSPLTPTNQSVLGTAFYDLNGNGLPDVPMTGAFVYLGDSVLLAGEDYKDRLRDTLPDTIIWNPNLLFTTVDTNGNFIFEGVNPRENQLIRICPIHEFSDLIGVDNTLDGDINEEVEDEVINISIEVDETDDGNDFMAYRIPIAVVPGKISGYVLKDVDEDLIGDLPSPNHLIWLYERGPDGLPATSPFNPLARDTSNENGFYEFSEIPNGEYLLARVGTIDGYDYERISRMDQTPEPGEPAADIRYISVNITDTFIEDQDNVFVVRRIDPNEPGSLSGTIYEDITSDGQPDEVSDIIVTVDIYERDDNGFITGPILYSMESNMDGSFVFPEIAPGNYAVTLRASSAYNTIFGSGNGGTQPLPDVFPITVTPGEEIIDSYFWIFTLDNIPAINGQVDEDTDGDGTGDIGQGDHTIELYFRGSDNLPTGDLLYKTNSTGVGSFNFTNLSTNQYILVLTGPSTFVCTSSGDESPEVGEPNSANGCRYIPVDFTEGVVDNDNNFTVFEN